MVPILALEIIVRTVSGSLCPHFIQNLLTCNLGSSDFLLRLRTQAVCLRQNNLKQKSLLMDFPRKNERIMITGKSIVVLYIEALKTFERLILFILL